MGGTFHFLQAGGLRLNDLVSGLPEAPGDVLHQCAHARYYSAEALFHAALKEQVDALVLTGSACGTPVPGSRAPWFLYQWFCKLDRAGIAVILRGDDLPAAPIGLSWPGNVTLVSPNASALVRLRSGQTVRVCDARGPLDHPGSADHRLVLSEGLPEAHRITRLGAPYWACDGAMGSLRNAAGEVKAFATGPIQRGDCNGAEHAGACLIQLQNDSATAAHPVLCEAVRWREEHLTIESGATSDFLLQQLLDRQRSMVSTASLTVVRWVLRLAANADPAWAFPQRQRELLAAVRAQRQPHVWTAGLMISDPLQKVEHPALSQARSVLAQLTAPETLDFATHCRLTVDQVPPASRTLARKAYLDRFAVNLDQRLRQELAAGLRSA